MKTFREQKREDDEDYPVHHIINVAGHPKQYLIVGITPTRCGDIYNGVSLSHAYVENPQNWVEGEGSWVISFEDLEAFYLAAKEYRDTHPNIEEEEEHEE